MTETITTIPTNYVAYSAAVEEIGDDERETFSSIADTFRAQAETVAGQEGHAVRASHAKSTGLLKGELIVESGLPPELAQGLFARPGRYDALVRLAQGPGEMLDDSISTHRGLALKILGVEGERIPQSREAATQDFVLETGKAFINRDASRFLVNLKAGVSKAPHMPDAFKSAVSKVALATEAMVEAVGGESKTLAFFGHPPHHPLAEAYFSQVPVRYGDYVAKVGLFPGEGLLAALGDIEIDTRDDPDAFRTAVTDFFARNTAEFEFRVQLCTDLAAMPVEDATVEWPEEQSPYRTVARLVLPAQAAPGDARAAYFDDVLSFRPANSLAAHRPLGQIMRARLFVYERLSDFRHDANHIATGEPRALADVPD